MGETTEIPLPVLLAMPALAERGWTPAMVRELLGDPDEHAPNPRFESGRPMRLWSAERVAQAEASEDFRVRSRQAARRSQAARGRVRARLDGLAEQIDSVPITVPVGPAAFAGFVDDILTINREGWHLRAHEDGEFGGQCEWCVDGVRALVDEDRARMWDRELLDLAHMLVVGADHRLADLVEQLSGKPGATRLRVRILEAIAEALPDLAEECARQIGLRRRAHPQVAVESPARDLSLSGTRAATVKSVQLVGRRVMWTFALDDGVEVTGDTSTKFVDHPGCRFYRWVMALMALDSLAPGTRLDIQARFGRSCQVVIEHGLVIDVLPA